MIRDSLPTIFLSVGFLAILAAVGTFLVNGEADRWTLTAGAVGIIFIGYSAFERPVALREAITSREARRGGSSTIATVAFVAILVLLNVLANRFTYRWDLTETKDFSISPQTEQILRSLNSDVKVTAFFQQGQSGQEELQDLIKEYQRHTNRISYEQVDPVLKPGVARGYQVESYGTTVVEIDGRRQNVTNGTEGDLTSAIVKLQRGAPRRVGWVTGHGELDIDSFDRAGASEIKRLIELENYKVEALPLIGVTEIAKDVAVVVLASPRQALLPQEVDALKVYLDRGGRLLVLLEPRSPGNPSELLDGFGVEVGDGVVLDYAANLQNDPLTPAITKYSPNPIMRTIGGDQSGRYATVFPAATMARPKRERDTALQVQTIAESSAERSWLESDTRIDLRTAQFDEGKDTNGPIPLAVSVVKTTPPPAGANERAPVTRVVVIGNANFATNALISFLPIAGNKDLVLNSLNWLSEDEQLMGVRSKISKDRTMVLSGTAQNVLLYSSFLFLPLAVVAVGGFVWWHRR
ncbi:MAG: hypothetical protein EPO26_09975 [Chloroflexota bacterium]|nr:MAG: hypothetical protein EPO26_09975 [Chloroflexota bacterium]